MNNICTSIEQSKKLVELGIDINTADFMWKYDSDKKVYYYKATITPYIFFNDIPAWSLSALLELMPNFTLNGFGNGQFNCKDERADCYALVNTCPLDAAFEMACWLLESHYI